jgi:tRNA G18 (ribose-2'-O)-methylase SpoU
MGMSARRQHELLAAMAQKAMNDKGYRTFIHRYDELLSWVDLDKYTPPSWLSKVEALDEFLAFHSRFCPQSAFRSDEEHTGDRSNGVSWQPRFDVTVAVDQVRSPYNVGSILRIIDNFGFKGMIHSTSWLRLEHPQLLKAARGCERWIPVWYDPDLVSWLKNTDKHVIGLETGKEAIKIEEWIPDDKCVLVVGNETYGIADSIKECCDRVVQIPMHGFKRSMNVHHALSIFGYKIVEHAQCRNRI